VPHLSCQASNDASVGARLRAIMSLEPTHGRRLPPGAIARRRAGTASPWTSNGAAADRTSKQLGAALVQSYTHTSSCITPRSCGSSMVAICSMLRYIFCAFVVLVASGCVALSQCKSGASLSELEAISIANSAAAEAGADLSTFKPPKAFFQYVEKDCTWSVFYDGIKPRPGNHFLVVVDDKTRQTTFVGGL
jgi:hypothetical protein